ncbi:2-dehydropantoate 2-reductase [Loktanella sp. DSM 29012]|uniref:ketopantoate reductase family protein n=1 Tax=Loktanella sp. DSM 29012 TaxID=1881056 RepID=UPI0008B6CECF|nr:2-dehydropantoate 2-reductase N-terminal domain-containing protein [Loktanella sp. DSM 29012]SEQ75403.1 2-dehydropantoate 2-reductase [Loktanella sp. DSM 29012]
MKLNPRIAFLGTGAQGASIAADFTRAGLDVTFIDQWPAHVEAMRENGLTVHMPTRTIHTPVKALHLCEVAEVKEPFDLVFLVVKAYDTRWATELIKPVLASDGFIIGLQNGMTHEQIASIVGRDRTIGAVIQIASNMWTPGVTTRQNDHDESWFALGALDPAKQAEVEDVATLLRHAGRVEVTDDIHSAKWMKLVVNAAELIPSAIIDTALNDAACKPGMLDFMRKAGYEAMEAALADGARIMPIIGMPPVMSNHPERFVDEIFEEVLKTFSREDTLTTSLQDWRKGRRAEIEDVNGWVVNTLAAHDKAAPINDHVVRMALQIEAGTRDFTDRNIDALLQIGKS